MNLEINNPAMNAAEANKRTINARADVSFQIDREVDRILEKIRHASGNGHCVVNVAFLPMIVGFDNEKFVLEEVVARLKQLGFGVSNMMPGSAFCGYDWCTEYRLYYKITW